MRRHDAWKWLLTLVGVGAGLGASPAAPSYQPVERTVERIRTSLAKPGATAQPNAPGWNRFFDALTAELRAYTAAPEPDDQLVSLNRIYQMSVALRGVSWKPAAELREELRGWLRPRVRLAWAERRLVDNIRTLAATADPGVRGNRQRWVQFVGDDLGTALREYDGSSTVAARLEALKRVYGALDALQARNRARPWVPSIELQRALNDLYNQPNIDISADVATVAPVLSNNVVESGPIYRKGYVTQVTAGPKTGFGLMVSDEGIAFYNSQMESSVTPITDFQNQLQQDRKGRRAAKLYYFNAASLDTAEVTIVAVLTTNGLRLGESYRHNVNLAVSSLKQPGKGLGRFFAAMLGLNQAKINQKVYEGAIGKVQQNVVQEAQELGAEKGAEAAAEQNAKLAQYLLFGRDAAVFRNLLITGLSLRSRPENALIGGTLRWRGAADQVGAYAPQPSAFAVPAGGVSADLHLSSILTNMTRGYLQSESVRSLHNLMIVTRKVAPNAPPREGIAVSENVDYPTFLKAVRAAQAANDPKVLAVRIKRPGHSPEFAADARGYLVALVHDFSIEVPAPPQAAKGGLAGPPAHVYRITAPRAEFTISFKVTPEAQDKPIRLSGRIEAFDPGAGARVYAVNEDETKAEPLNPFTNQIVLGVFRAKVQGQPIDVPLSDVKLRGFAIREVSPLDPTGWIRVNLERTSSSPAAGLQR